MKSVCQDIKYFSTEHFNPFHSGYWSIGTLANSVDPDEMPHNAAFHQRLHCLLGLHCLLR